VQFFKFSSVSSILRYLYLTKPYFNLDSISGNSLLIYSKSLLVKTATIVKTMAMTLISDFQWVNIAISPKCFPFPKVS